MRTIGPAERERLTLDAITAVEAVDADDWSAKDVLDLLGPEVVFGLVLYANYLEACLHLVRGVDVPTIRQSGRDTASSFRAAT